MSECDGGTGVSEYMCCAGRTRKTDFAKHVARIKNYLLGCFGNQTAVFLEINMGG
jgi:hypothetical protein